MAPKQLIYNFNREAAFNSCLIQFNFLNSIDYVPALRIAHRNIQGGFRTGFVVTAAPAAAAIASQKN